MFGKNRGRGLIIAAAMSVLFTTVATAQDFNEIYINQTGTDDREFIELIGTPSASLDGVCVLGIESNGGSTIQGTVDLVVCLDGQTIPGDGYYVLGNDAVIDLDISLGATNSLENSSTTFFLISGANTATVTALDGVDLDTDDDGTFDAAMAPADFGTVEDSIAVIDDDENSVTFGAAAVRGPQGLNMPSGVYRGNDAPNDWCFHYLDFDPDINLNEPQTPGFSNSACGTSLLGGCCLLGECSVISQSECENDFFVPGIYQGDGTDCTGVVCPTTGACCLASGCQDDLSFTECDNMGGVYQNDGSLCSGVTCPDFGACCTIGGFCSDRTSDQCGDEGGTYQGDGTDCGGTGCPAGDTVVLNEILINPAGSDTQEYVEIASDAGVPVLLDGLYYIVIGDGSAEDGSGVIEEVIDLTGQIIPADGYFLMCEDTATFIADCDLVTDINLENDDNVTHMLVAGFNGSNGQDLDTDNDCVLDVLPWAGVLDTIGMVEEQNIPFNTECHYGPPQIGPEAIFVPSHIKRCPDIVGTWDIGVFEDPNDVTADDTPGSANTCAPKGACCIFGTCTDFVSSTDCSADGGMYQGDDVTCDTVSCPPAPEGACCISGVCTDLQIQPDCEGSGGFWGGDFSTCGGTLCPVPGTYLLNELYISHGGFDDREFAELTGTAIGILDGVCLIQIDSDDGSSGDVDRVSCMDHTHVMPPDGFFVLGDTIVSNVDFVIGEQDTFENGSTTYYLINAGEGNGDSVAAALATAGDLDADDDGAFDAGLAPSDFGTVLDSITVVDTDAEDLAFTYGSAATRGPEGIFFPPGVFRDGDAPGDWCFIYSDFDPDVNLDFPRTPGSNNTTCDTIGVGSCCIIGACSVIDQDTCENDFNFLGIYGGDGTICDSPCPDTGACCTAGGCLEGETFGSCVDLNGIFQGVTSTCGGVTCPAFGACCAFGFCDDGQTEDDCINGGGSYEGDDTTCGMTACPGASNVIINEIRADQNGGDDDEYIELATDAGIPVSLDGLTYVVIGDGGALSGTIEEVIDLTGNVIPADGYFLIVEDSFAIDLDGDLVDDLTAADADMVLSSSTNALNLENDDNYTHLLVAGFSGALAQDLDADDDCVLDITPWVGIVDIIAFVEEELPANDTECHYGPPSVGPTADPEQLAPMHIKRCEDFSGAFEEGSADLPPIGDDTPGFANACGVTGTCDTAANCVDLDADNKIDDVCTWGECIDPPSGTCNVVARTVPADVGGAFGLCPIDGFCNIHDRTHALTCFGGTNSCALINIDAGGGFGLCPPDGFCNIHDANHALTCFGGTNTCVCGPAPEGGGVVVVDDAALKVVTDRRSAAAGDRVEVRVFISDALEDFQSYQLHMAASGGDRGTMTLVDIQIDDRKDYVFGSSVRFDAVNTAKSQMLAGLDVGSKATSNESYLATFIYEVSKDASGSFVIDVLHDEANEDQTFLVAGSNGKIDVRSTAPAVIHIGSKSNRRAAR
jgi:hypothetical protein